MMPNSEMLGVVEDMARRLLTEEEVAAVMSTCRRVKDELLQLWIHVNVFCHNGFFLKLERT